MLQIIAEHQLLIRVLCAPLALLFALVAAAGALRPPGKRGHHERGVRRGAPAEIVRHRLGGRERTWAGTCSCRVVAVVAGHALDDTVVQPWRVANLIEWTGEITFTELEDLMARPELVGAVRRDA